MINISEKVSKNILDKVFRIILKECNNYQVVFPNGEPDEENPLLGGKDYFNNLPGLKIIPSKIMDNSSEYSGTLNENIKQKFYIFVEPFFKDLKPELWYFRLLKDNEVYLICSDFTDFLLEGNKEIKLLLVDHGIEIDSIF